MEDTPIISKTCVNCNNIEVDLISVYLECLQILIEYSKIRSNANLLNYLSEQVRNNLPNEVYSFLRIVDCKYTSLSRKKQKQENIINDNCVKSIVLRSERKIEKLITFTVKKYVL